VISPFRSARLWPVAAVIGRPIMRSGVSMFTCISQAILAPDKSLCRSANVTCVHIELLPKPFTVPILVDIPTHGCPSALPCTYDTTLFAGGSRLPVRKTTACNRSTIIVSETVRVAPQAPRHAHPCAGMRFDRA
jgi:hypothetical protein